MPRTVEICSKKWVRYGLLALLFGYGVSYFIIRQHRFSYDYLADRIAVTSPEEAQEWVSHFESKQKELPLDYSFDEALYLFYYPIIHVDSVFTGRIVISPYEEPMPTGTIRIKMKVLPRRAPPGQ